MPTSHPEGRDWVAEHVRWTTAPVIVDIGCGMGTYSDVARGWRPEAHWIGVEIHLPYVKRYELMRKYDTVVIGDLRSYVFPREPFVLLAGDVIEHVHREEALAFLARAREAAEEIMISVPIVHYPQGPLEGNEHETHLDQWTFEEMAEQLPGCETWCGDVVGRYWWKRSESV
ncbi:methyltransferase [Mycobacterium phage Phrappuccino]|uniref:Methyltransferase n=1 Tax=Mycobacterium phage Phrappuccino TaxID=2591223 RepID=A0A514DDY2_9CAUD|nr:class I SAM-dependent methyltransferase [Mycobacterium phage Phrappuccino]QDH91820.1 methyltransferase [Mycobacterium phage Phrappuccino]QIQ63262.1 methyltransferase [Mycobacterium phage Settecandela]